MNRNKEYHLLAIVFALSFLGFLGSACAQDNAETVVPSPDVSTQPSSNNISSEAETPNPEPIALPEGAPVPGADVPDDKKYQVVANVDITNLEIVSQEGNNFKLAFDIINHQNAQPQIKYALFLGNKSDKNFIFHQTYDEVINLSAKEKVHREVEFDTPGFLDGTYELTLLSETTGGLPLGIARRDVTLKGNNSYINLGECYLSVSGEDRKFSIQEGVDVGAEEKLTGICKIENKSGGELEFSKKITTYRRDVFGKVINRGREVGSKEKIQSGEKREVSIEIPKDLDPQAYSSWFFLADNEGGTISNEAIFHYVIRGLSGAINNIRFDKDFYQKSDTAKIYLSYSLSADSFSGSRMRVGTDFGEAFIEGIITDMNGKKCTEKFKKSLGNGAAGNTVLDVEVKSYCVNPKLQASLTDKNGKSYDDSEWGATSKNVPEKKKSNFPKILIIAISVIIVFVALYYIFKKSRVISIFIFGLFFSGLLFLSAEKADAVTVNIAFTTPAGGNFNSNFVFTVSNYPICKGGTLRFDTYYQAINCGNTVYNSSHELDAWYYRHNIDTPGVWQFWGRYGYTLTSPIYRAGGIYPGYDNDIAHQVDFLALAIVCDGVYGCNSGYSPTGREWYDVVDTTPNPANLSVACNAAGNQATISWSPAAWSTGYGLRVDDTSNLFDGDCSPINPGDVCENTASTSRVLSVVPGRRYDWWVHSYNACGWSSGAVSNFTCYPAPTIDLKLNGLDGTQYVSYGTNSTLSWTGTNLASCTASIGWAGGKAVPNGSETTSAITAPSTDFRLTCTGLNGSTVPDTVRALVPPPPTNPVQTCAFDGKSATISWTKAVGFNEIYLRTRQPDGTTVFYDDNAYTGSSYTLNNIIPGQNYNWWIHTKYPTNGAYSSHIGGTVNCPTHDCTLTANPTTVPNNGQSTLTWITQNVDTCTASGDWSGPKAAADGTYTFPINNITSFKTFNLKCWSGGVLACDRTVNVSVNSCIPPQSRALNTTCCDGGETCSEGLPAPTYINNFDGDAVCSGKCQYKCSDPTAKVVENCVPPSNGECGTATQREFCQKPTVGLCIAGIISGPNLLNGKWQWTCEGEHGGNDVPCSATRSCSFQEVAPN